MSQKKRGKSTYRYTALAMKVLEKVLGSKIIIKGLENIPPKPVLFVCNHFTRSETFVVPYIIYKYTNRQVRCLADNGLFVGILGRFLKSVGTISTKDAKRDRIIISDLVTGNYDWMIYPEGSMIKSKEINRSVVRSTYLLGNHKDQRGQKKVRTGSAILGLKSEIYRTDLIDAHSKNHEDVLRRYKKELGVEFDSSLKNLNTHIVPVNITYYPIRPGKNIIQKIAGRLFKKLPKIISEELEIEGNLLMGANINISFGKAINLSDNIKKVRKVIYKIPIIGPETKVNMVLKYLKYNLTNQFMKEIYSGTRVNFDHLFVAILYFYPKEDIEITHLKKLIYLSAQNILNLKKYYLSNSIAEEAIYKLFSDEEYGHFTDIVKLALDSNVLKLSDDNKSYIINKFKLENQSDFHEIRLENTMQVILNEFLLLHKALLVIKRNALLSNFQAQERSFKYLLNEDMKDFDQDYKKYYNKELSKRKSIGVPVFLNNKNSSKNKSAGILLVHGYLSAPKEMEEAAKYFNKIGFKTYCVRLKGHATAPINLENVTWQDWYGSYNRGYSALKLVCETVSVIGFSTGGLLALIAASNKNSTINKLIVINPALKIRDFRSRFAGGVDLWNEALEKINVQKMQLRYVEGVSENPQINYSRNYIKAIDQLENLTKYCDSVLDKILCDILVIQSSNDPTIDQESSKKIMENAKLKSVVFEEIQSNKHCIVRGEGSNKIFKLINTFLTIGDKNE